MMLFGSDEDPSIRISSVFRTIKDQLISGKRLIWIYFRLVRSYRDNIRQGLLHIALALVIITGHNPISAAQASISQVENYHLADFDFQTLEALTTDEITQNLHGQGFIQKPFIVKTTFTPAPVPPKPKVAILPQITENSYPYGYCTWWAKSKRTDMPNFLGNAKNWLSNAQRAGFTTSKTPQSGAVIVTTESPLGHVGYVEKVSGDELTVTDMNLTGWGKVSRRTLSTSSKVIRGYIY